MADNEEEHHNQHNQEEEEHEEEVGQEEEEEEDEENEDEDQEVIEEAEEEDAENENNSDADSNFVSGVKESPEVVEADLQTRFISGYSQADRDRMATTGSSAQRRRGAGGFGYFLTRTAIADLETHHKQRWRNQLHDFIISAKYCMYRN